MPDWAALAREQYCYLTTTGRVSGEPREIEIWFALVGILEEWDSQEPGSTSKTIVYMLSGGQHRANWVRNLQAEPKVTIRIGDHTFPGTAHVVEDSDEDAMARRLLLRKYAGTYSGDLTDWGSNALPVAVDLDQG